MNNNCTRFAPSPTGYLHLGHAASALIAANWAKANSADFVLRIEDIDQTRCRPEFETAIYDDLHWLGLNWQQPVRRQSEHLLDYQLALSELQKQGLLYRCFLTRREVMAEINQAPHGIIDVYSGPSKHLSATQEAELLEQEKPFAWRLSLSKAKEVLGKLWHDLEWLETGSGQSGLIKAEPEVLGDVILARKDISTSYHLSVTHDDALQNITHIIRGNDLFESTHTHVLLQVLLGLPTPIYHHHALITDEQGKRLAKRDGAKSLRELRENGISAEQVRDMVRL
ncbi:MAG: tRNA glutamyl-Q(34) synthetase GluQRS [Robiginitomaculum sp.]|nr:tRNA glutamyl-Q(34) synthetase GluQRS [Robiginitomaculum sp.]